MNLADILQKYQQQTLPGESDADLHAAIITLEKSERTFFDDCDLSTWSLVELQKAREARHQMQHVQRVILELLLKRDGCND